MQRREFLNWVGVGGLASCLPLATAACIPAATAQNTAKTVKAGTIADLNKAGFLSLQVAGKSAIVIRDPVNPKSLLAVNQTCTHKGCTVNWKAKEKKFQCPCHGAAFAANGNVLQGPATKPLTTYSVKIQGNTVLVQPK